MALAAPLDQAAAPTSAPDTGGYLVFVVLIALVQDHLLFPRWALGGGAVTLPAAAERLSVDVPGVGALVGVVLPAEHTPPADAAVLLGFGGNAWDADLLALYPQAVTAQMVANFHAGGAAINQLARAAGARLEVIALDLDRPTGDFTDGPAMTEAEVLAAMARGAGAVDRDAQALVLGEMGIGNSTVAAALACARFGGAPGDWVGPGTGTDAAGIARKAAAVAAGIARHRPDPADGLGLLAAFGGREQAAIAGAILAARAARVPVILDGFICTAAAAVLSPWPGALDHCLAGHFSAEPGHARLLAALGLAPILSLDLRLGEGTGAALALSVLRAAVAAHDGMATFAEAGVAGAEGPDGAAGAA